MHVSLEKIQLKGNMITMYTILHGAEKIFSLSLVTPELNKWPIGSTLIQGKKGHLYTMHNLILEFIARCHTVMVMGFNGCKRRLDKVTEERKSRNSWFWNISEIVQKCLRFASTIQNGSWKGREASTFTLLWSSLQNLALCNPSSYATGWTFGLYSCGFFCVIYSVSTSHWEDKSEVSPLDDLEFT